MKTFVLALLPLLVTAASAQDRPWQVLNDSAAADAAVNFSAPPPEYSPQFTWGWSGPVDQAVIDRDLDHMKALNVQAAIIEPGARMTSPYLDPGYFDTIRTAVQEAKKRNMRLWIMDEGGYPSGFAGGKFTIERPDLRMKALSAVAYVISPGRNFTRAVDANTICALAVDMDSGNTTILDASSGNVSWTAPATGNWEVIVPQWNFRSGPTRSANSGTGAKDNTHSLMDYLAPEASKLFVQWTFDAYTPAIGDEYGKTVLGFRGDEAAFGFNPWTPDFLAEFQKRKGYDLRQYLAWMAAIRIGTVGPNSKAPDVPGNLDVPHRVFADYCDVWSSLMGENFFSAEGQWCADHNMEMQMHIEHEEILPQLAIADGDFYKDMRNLQVPGIDTIWHQIWHDVVADFPKLASSDAHLYGHPYSMCEAFAAYNPVPDINEARWIINHLMVLGINRYEFMFWPASTGGARGGRGGAAAGTTGTPATAPALVAAANPAEATAASAAGAAPVAPTRGGGGGGPRGFYNDPAFPTLASYTHRLSYLLGQGRPAAQIGVYIPSSSFWFGDTEANTNFLKIVHELLQHQRDLDFVDEQALSSVLQLRGGELVNQSGQAYRGIVIPPVDAISQAALDNLRAFAAAGGKVIFIGHAPSLVAGETFLFASGPPDISWATLEPTIEVTQKVLDALPTPDVTLDQPTTWLKYLHRHLKDGDVYFFFNEGMDPVTLKATVATSGAAQHAQDWNGDTGEIKDWDGAVLGSGTATVPLDLPPWATKVLVVSTAPAATVASAQ